jgi:hypothetical protein
VPDLDQIKQGEEAKMGPLWDRPPVVQDASSEHGAGGAAGWGRKNTVKTEPVPGVLATSINPR